MASRRTLRFQMEQSAKLAVDIAETSSVMGPSALKSIVRKMCIDVLEDELLIDDMVLGGALAIMIAQN